MDKKTAALGSLMSEALKGVDPAALTYLRVGTEWTEVEVLTDPFVVYRRERYLPAILVEQLDSEERYLLFVAAVSIAKCLESMREERGALIGLRIRVRKNSDDKFAAYEVEELAD